MQRRDGKPTLRKRASREVERLIAQYTPSRLPDGRKADLTRLMEAEAKRYVMTALPEKLSAISNQPSATPGATES